MPPGDQGLRIVEQAYKPHYCVILEAHNGQSIDFSLPGSILSFLQ
jgi:hypothetical protein